MSYQRLSIEDSGELSEPFLIIVMAVNRTCLMLKDGLVLIPQWGILYVIKLVTIEELISITTI
jgi:hypothetical protein